MTDSKKRISKQPDERRQEMLDTAMRVFTQKGYEQTTMRDIAKEMNVVPGLCYRYFKSKQVLYRAAVKEYADNCCAPVINILDNTELDIDAINSAFAPHFATIGDNEKYHSFFHKPENKDFAVMLNYTICSILTPYMSDLLKRLAEAGKVIVSDVDVYARFLLFSLAFVMDDNSKPIEQRTILASEITKTFLKAEGR